MIDYCDHCDGEGRIRNNQTLPDGRYQFGYLTCPTCLGSGNRPNLESESNPSDQRAGGEVGK